jgi:flavin-dependent dehydrogenase
MKGHAQNIVIIGGGIASSTLAILLTRAGRNVHVIDKPVKLDLLVGESLLPAVVPFLQELGVEEEMKEFSMYKPGAAFIMRGGRPLLLDFEQLSGMTSTYSYNIPRPRFDEMLKNKAVREGVAITNGRVRVSTDSDRVVLDQETLETCGLTHQPDLVIDCSGRAQVLRHALGLGGKAGNRHDTCLFAHYRDVNLGVDTPGYVVITSMEVGWCWRIPLKDRMSVGVIVDTERLKTYGATPEERLDAILREDPIMSEATRGAERITQVKVFNNYQWVTERFFGENWVMAGDSAGFVDPALSSGVLLALHGASSLARALTGNEKGQREAMARWERKYRKHILAWQELVDYFYDGRLFAMIMQGHDYESIHWLGIVNRHIARNFQGVVMGARTISPYSQRLVRFLINKAIVKYQPAEWAVV